MNARAVFLQARSEAFAEPPLPSLAAQLAAEHRARQHRMGNAPRLVTVLIPEPQRDPEPPAYLTPEEKRQFRIERARHKMRVKYPRPEGVERRIFVREILEFTAAYYGTTVFELKSKRRAAPTVRARHVASYLCRTLTAESFPQIGRALNRDWTTIIYAAQKVGIQVGAALPVNTGTWSKIHRRISPRYLKYTVEKDDALAAEIEAIEREVRA